MWCCELIQEPSESFKTSVDLSNKRKNALESLSKNGNYSPIGIVIQIINESQDVLYCACLKTVATTTFDKNLLV